MNQGWPPRQPLTDRRPAGARWREPSVLVLSRRERESIVIPRHRVEIAVVEIRGDAVKLGIVAPDEVGIYRREVWLAIERQMEKEEPRKG